MKEANEKLKFFLPKRCLLEKSTYKLDGHPNRQNCK